MRVYLSGPMTGIPEFNFPRFREVAAHLRAQGHEVVSPAELDEEAGVSVRPDQTHLDGGSTEYNELLGRDEDVIANDPDLQALVLLEGWQDSTGAMREGERAIDRGLALFEHIEGGVLVPLPWSDFRREAERRIGRAERDYGETVV